MNETRDQRGKYTKKASALVALILILSLCTVVRVESAPLLWSPDHILPANSVGIDQASSIIQTSDGRIWAVWEKGVWEGHAIFYSTSSDYGLTWTPAKNLTNVPNFEINTDPSVIQLSNGTIMVVYSSWRPLPTPPPAIGFNVEAYPSYLSIPAGSSANSTIKVTSFNSFNESVDLSYSVFDSDGNITASFTPTQVTPPPNGHANSTMTVSVHLNATTLQDYFIQVKGMCTLLGWSDATTVRVRVTHALGPSSSSPSSVSASDLSPDSNQNYTLYYKTSNNLGATWSKENLVPLTSNVGENLSPSMMQAANGTIWLAWTSTRIDPSNSEIFYKTTSNGITWSDDIRLTFNAAVNASTDARPAIAQMQDGRIWVAWHSNRYGEYQEIVYNIYNGTAWAVPLTSATRLTSNTLEDTSATILQSQDEVIRVFWSSCDMQLESAHDIYYVESTNNGLSWTNPPILFPTDTPEDMYPSVAQSVDSRIWVMRTTNKTGGWDLYFKTSLIHNVAVKKIAPSQVRVYQQEIVNVNVTVENQGDYDEPTIIVRLYANTTFLDSRTIALNTRTSTIVAFAWNTFGFARGNYTMKAEVYAVAGEVYVGDNVRTEGDVAVKLLGDVDDNGLVEVRDLWAVGKAYGSIPGNPSWNEEADLNGDNAVNMTDVSSLSGNFGSAG